MTADANRRTVEAYERYARAYAAAVSPHPTGIAEEGLRRLAAIVGGAGTVLEVGSGPGWDADHLESLDVEVRRTDVTAAFRALQAERGKRVERLDLLVDELGGPWDGVLALHVLQHIERDRTAGVLRRVAAALRPGGAFLVTLREGDGELWERGASGDYRVVLRGQAEFSAALAEVGLGVEWTAHCVDSDGAWLHALARR